MTSTDSTVAGVPVRYAGFWIRALATAMDATILGVPLWGVHSYFSSIQFECLLTALGMLYTTLPISSSWQATPGMKLCGIKVIDYQGDRLTILHAAGRWLAHMLWLIPRILIIFLPANSLNFNLGWGSGMLLAFFLAGLVNVLPWGDFLFIVFTAKKQAFHDLLAKTLVVYREPKAAQ